jgi:hypothetical protein
MERVMLSLIWLIGFASYCGCYNAAPQSTTFHESQESDSLRGAEVLAQGSSSDNVKAFGSLEIFPSRADREVYEEISLLDFEFSIRNQTNRPIRINEVNAGCACTSIDLRDSVIAPHSSTPLRVRYNVASYFGELPVRKILVLTDDVSVPKLICEVGGRRHKRYHIEPASVNFGHIESGRGAAAELTIEASGEDNELVFDQAMVTSPFVSAKLLKTESTELGSRHRVSIRLTENAPVGYIESKLFIPRKQNDQVGPVVWVRAHIAGPLKPVPPVAFFGLLSKQDEASDVCVRLMPTVARDVQPRITDVRFEELPRGITAFATNDSPDLIKLQADPAKLDVGTLEKDVVIFCKVHERICRIELGLRVMVSE